MVILDYITGILKAIYNKKVSSEIGAKGIVKKICFFVLVAVSTLVDRIVGNTGAIRTTVIYFFVANEGISILENCGSMGLPLPNILKSTLEQLRNDNKNKKISKTR